MLDFNLSTKGDVNKIKLLGGTIDDGIQLALLKIGTKVQTRAKINAPFQTGALRKSISTDFSKLKQGMVVVGSPLAYARRREFENFKNPDRKYYLKRAYTEQQNEMLDIFMKSLFSKL